MVSKAVIIAAFIAMVAAAPIEPAAETSHELYTGVSDSTYKPGVLRIIGKRSEDAPEFYAATKPSVYKPDRVLHGKDGSKDNNPEIYPPVLFRDPIRKI